MTPACLFLPLLTLGLLLLTALILLLPLSHHCSSHLSCPTLVICPFPVSLEFLTYYDCYYYSWDTRAFLHRQPSRDLSHCAFLSFNVVCLLLIWDFPSSVICVSQYHAHISNSILSLRLPALQNHTQLYFCQCLGAEDAIIFSQEQWRGVVYSRHQNTSKERRRPATCDPWTYDWMWPSLPFCPSSLLRYLPSANMFWLLNIILSQVLWDLGLLRVPGVYVCTKPCSALCKHFLIYALNTPKRQEWLSPMYGVELS